MGYGMMGKEKKVEIIDDESTRAWMSISMYIYLLLGFLMVPWYPLPSMRLGRCFTTTIPFLCPRTIS
jgi:hypothetical protein